MSRSERIKSIVLSSWFFLVVTTLWLLKPIRQASLLAHLGSQEIPYVRLGSVVVVAIVVLVYTRVVNRLSRLAVARAASLGFAAVLVAFWLALQIGGEALGASRWFVWSVFIMVDVYSTVMIGIFWTYTNDVVSRSEADKLYGPIGLGGILGGIAGGAIVDSAIRLMGHVNLILVCAGLSVVCAGFSIVNERLLHPPARPPHEETRPGLSEALEGVREVGKSRYLLMIVGIVVAYEFAAAMSDFVVSVIFERSFPSEVELGQMFGRLGWIVSVTALVSQIVIVPILLPAKRVALMVPALAMLAGTIGLAVAPVVGMAIVLSAADRGLNYSLQQVTKESLYVPLTDAQKYKAKAFIDMVVDRGGKALSALTLMWILASYGASVTVSLGVTAIALLVWAAAAYGLGRTYARTIESKPDPEPERRSIEVPPAPGAQEPCGPSSAVR